MIFYNTQVYGSDLNQVIWKKNRGDLNHDSNRNSNQSDSYRANPAATCSEIVEAAFPLISIFNVSSSSFA